MQLPNGKYTRSQQRYLREWRKLIKQAENLTGLRCYAFNPGVCLQEIEDKKALMYFGPSVCLPVWLIKRLWARMSVAKTT